MRELTDPIFIKAVMETQWFEDTEFNLYIPDPWGDEWVISSGDHKIESTLDRWWREVQSVNPDEYGLPPVPPYIYEPLGLIEVSQLLKRHNEVDGFYHA